MSQGERPTLTLDTNCIIALENREDAASSVRKIVDAFHQGSVELAVPAIAASERQSDGGYLESFEQFQHRLAALDLSGVRIIEPIAYYGIGFYGHGLWADEAMLQLERSIHQVLHPDIEFTLAEYCNARGIELDTTVPCKKWRNAKCDVQAMWSHIWFKQKVFVSSDRNFLKDSKVDRLVKLGAGRILLPEEAARIF